MPPKGSGKGRRKAVGTDMLKNGSIEDTELQLIDKAPEDLVGGKKANLVDEIFDTEENIEKSVSAKGRKKAKANETNSVANGSADLEENASESKELEVVSKRGRKKAEVKDQKPIKAEESNGDISESIEDSTEIVKNAMESVDSEDQESKETKVVTKRGRRKAEVKDEQLAKTDESNGGTLDAGNSVDVDADDDMESKKEQPVLTKRGRRKVQDSKSKMVDLEPEPEKEESFPKRRGGRNAKQQTIDDAFPASSSKAEVPISRGGRKRKNIEAKDKGTKKGKGAGDEMNKDEMEVRVALERSPSLDRRAQEEADSDTSTQAKTKTAKGASKSTKGKRKIDDEQIDSKPAKVPKESAKSSSKKEKNPDVAALDFGNKSTSPDGKKWNLKISSWNISGIRAWLEKDGLSYLHHEKPDVLCIQETKCSDDKLPKEVVTVEGYHCYWLAGDKGGYSGVGLLSKEEPISVDYGIGKKEHDNEGRVITAEYGKFYLVTSYVPNAGRGLVRLKYRQEWDEDFRAYLKKLDKKKPVVLCGDLNVAHEEIDLANPKTNKKNAGFTKEERDGFSTLLSEGFIDTFRHLYPDEKGAYTFWTYMMNARAKNVGWRLDYFVISKRFVKHLCDNVIRKDVFGSDHCPIVLFLSV